MGPAELRQQRIALNLTQAELGRSLGVSRNTIARWERGELPIQHPQLVELALGSLDRSAPAPQPTRHNLPVELSSFIGREEECAELARTLATTRLLTLTGPGGIGKTRLALRVAAAVIDSYPDGVWLAELGALAEPSLVPETVCSALQIERSPAHPVLDTLCTAVRSRRLLLVLDNCEHLVQASAELVDVLRRVSPGLHVLATSREPLAVAGEVTRPVPPLDLPGESAARPEAQSAGAIRLFIERARAANPFFAVSDRALEAVAEVCRRVDGIPLAIELAATRAASDGLDQILAGLDDRFRILSLGARTAPLRQRTLRATVEWSYALLGSSERAALAAVSVFAGGWSLNAARAICAVMRVPQEQVHDLHTSLVMKSLIVATAAGEDMRYRLLDTIRAFALERLEESGMEAAVRARHATYFLEFAERAGAAAAHGPVRIPWLEVLERDHDNLREALRWTTDHIDDESTRVRWAGALGPLWHLRGHVSEGRAWLTALGVTPERAQPTLHWARALTQASILHSLQGAFDVALECFDAAVPIARSTGDSETLMRLLINVGAHLITRGEFVRAGGLLEEALATSRRTGDRVREALSLEYLAILAYRQGDYPSAQAHCYACLTIASQLQDPVTESDSRRILGHIALRLGDASTARAEYEISLAHARAAGYRVAVALALLGLGQAAYAVGDRIRARAILAEGVATARELGLEYDIATALLGFGALAADMNEPSTALRIASAAARVQRSFSSVLPTLPSAAVERALARAKQTVGPDVAAEATLRGQTDSIEESLRLALELDPTVRTPGPLSSREMQVARLIEQGLTNREIAARLVISQRTAATHVEHILAKLNLHSRIEVALWMSTRGEQESAH